MAWTLRVSGQMLRRPDFAPADPKMARFSDHFSKIFVQLDERLYPGADSTIEWHKPLAGEAFGGFEVRRVMPERGTDATCDVVITLYRDFCPRKFRASRPLSKLLLAMASSSTAAAAAPGSPAALSAAVAAAAARGDEHISKPLAMALVWQHVQRAGLEDRVHPRLVHLDDALREALETGAESLPDDELFALLDLQLLPPEPLVIKYTVRVEGRPEHFAHTYEIPVEMPPRLLPSEAVSAVLPPSGANTASVRRMDAEMQRLVLELHRYRRRQHMFMALRDAPAQALEMVTASLARSSGGVDRYSHEGMRSARTYEEEWVPDAVDRYFAKEARRLDEERRAREAANRRAAEEAHAERKRRRDAERAQNGFAKRG